MFIIVLFFLLFKRNSVWTTLKCIKNTKENNVLIKANNGNTYNNNKIIKCIGE